MLTYFGYFRLLKLILPVSFYFKKIVFYIGVQLINNVVLVPGIQQSDSVTHIYLSILFFLPHRENKLKVTKGKRTGGGGVGINQELEMNRYTILNIKWIIHPRFLNLFLFAGHTRRGDNMFKSTGEWLRFTLPRSNQNRQNTRSNGFQVTAQQAMMDSDLCQNKLSPEIALVYCFERKREQSAGGTNKKQ